MPSAVVQAQDASGSIRGVVYDKDFDTPLPGAQVLAVEARSRAVTTAQGNFVLAEIPPGKYTLVFTKEGYVRQVRADVVVHSGRLTEVDVALPGEFTDLDELLVQDLLIFASGSEVSLLKLRFETPALLDSIGSELMSRAGAGDAASALRLVAGASVQDGKYAVVRGLPDRYVSSQMNGVRLPTADENKRAVQLDQFPSSVIESIQVSKTFTPDQQGDASGGAVDLKLKGIPDESILQFKLQFIHNTAVRGRDDFLTYSDGGVGRWGFEGDDRDIQEDNLGGNWDGAVGVSPGEAPRSYKWSLTAGGKHEIDDGWKLGGLASFFYERTNSFRDRGVDDSRWVVEPGGGLVPQTNQGTPSDGDFKTALFDVTQGKQSIQWGGLATIGVENENHSIGLTYLYTHSADDTATLAEDTRGKEYFFPGYDPNDPSGPGNTPNDVHAAPYLRLETLDYVERGTTTLQFHGRHALPFASVDAGADLKIGKPSLNWSYAHSESSLDQPDKRLFGSLWLPASFNPGFPPFVPPFTSAAAYFPYKPAANFNLGNSQRIFKSIEETSDQFSLSLELPFKQWSEERGFWKSGLFHDDVDRKFGQDSFSNFGDAGATYPGDFSDYWSTHFPQEDHPITASDLDVDYRGKQEISAAYSMIDLPLSSVVGIVAGARFESTEIGIVNSPEVNATWYPPGSSAPVQLNPGDADVTFEQDDVLPALGVEVKPTDGLTIRGSYSRTIARQTFKELTPILQQEYLGGPVFIGNPDLGMSKLENFDLRVDYEPYEGGLLSASWFDKRIEDPIEYVQRVASFTYTTPVNYPEGELSGFEFEVRQSLGRLWKPLEGASVGVNATFIDSEVTLTDDEIAAFAGPGLQAPMRSRDMTNAPEHLYNLFVTYDLESTRTKLAVFYTIQGDTLVAGAGESNGNFVPSIYATEYDTLNLSVVQDIGPFLKLQFQAKNLTNPTIRQVYRSEYIDEDATRTAFTRGIEYSISLGASFSF